MKPFQLLHAEPLYAIRERMLSEVQLFGRTLDGQSCCVRVPYQTYFYLQGKGLHKLKKKLRSKIQSLPYRPCPHCTRSTQRPFLEPCYSIQSHHVPQTLLTVVEQTQAKPLIGYTSTPQTYQRVEITYPFWLRHVKYLAASLKLSVAEVHVDYVTRFMTDHQLTGMGWVQVEDWSPTTTRTNCDYEGRARTVRAVTRDACAPLRILAFDIECISPSREFPCAAKRDDAVIQISAVSLRYGETMDQARHDLFVLQGCDAIANCTVHPADTEADLLQQWRDFIVEQDFDILTGYNIQSFDLPYLFDRARHRCPTFRQQGRVRTSKHVHYEDVFDSKQQSGHWDRHLISGRVVLDLYEKMIRGGKKYRSYKLNAICELVLGDKKEDMDYENIYPFHLAGPTQRAEIGRYCVKDSVLVMRLLLKQLILTNAIELARVLGVQLSQSWEKGQTFKVESLLLRTAHSLGFVGTTYPRSQGKVSVPDYDHMHLELNQRMGTPEKGTTPPDFVGAIVIEPDRGFYQEPIATLDFASLYPSIMMCWNLSFDTLLFGREHAQREGLSPDDFEQSPNGYQFVRTEKQKGLLPIILNQLLTARKRAKKAMAAAETPFLKDIMNGRQLALKVCANSVYGYTGAKWSSYPCQGISSSVTAYGRKLIYDTKDYVEAHYPPCKVIYGDTDSVMIKFPAGTTVTEAIEGAKRMEQEINPQLYRSPVFIEYEKVFCPYLLMKKKKYVGYKYENDPTQAKIDAKGIVMVRRDNCTLAADTQTKVVEILLQEQDYNKAFQYLQSVLVELVNGNIPPHRLIQSKELKKKWIPTAALSLSPSERAEKYPTKEYYATPTEAAVVARKMEDRGKVPPKRGHRVPYLIVRGKERKVCERAEHPSDVSPEQIDLHYYLHQQMTKPFLRIFEEIIGARAAAAMFRGHHLVPQGRLDLWGVSGDKRKRIPEAPSLPVRPRYRQRSLQGLKPASKKVQRTQKKNAEYQNLMAVWNR